MFFLVIIVAMMFIMTRCIFAITWTMGVMAGRMMAMVVVTTAEEYRQHDGSKYCFHIIPLHQI
jgi:hypothetical protein